MRNYLIKSYGFLQFVLNKCNTLKCNKYLAFFKYKKSDLTSLLKSDKQNLINLEEYLLYLEQINIEQYGKSFTKQADVLIFFLLVEELKNQTQYVGNTLTCIKFIEKMFQYDLFIFDNNIKRPIISQINQNLTIIIDKLHEINKETLVKYQDTLDNEQFYDSWSSSDFYKRFGKYSTAQNLLNKKMIFDLDLRKASDGIITNILTLQNLKTKSKVATM